MDVRRWTRRSAARASRGKKRRRISSEMSARVDDRTSGPGSHLDGVGQIRHDHGVHPGGCRVQLRVHGDSMRAGRHRERGRNRALRRGSRGRDLLLARGNRNRGGGRCRDHGRRRRRGRGVRIVRAGPRRRPADLLQLLVVAAHACRAWECDVSTLPTEHSTRNQAKTATCVWHRTHRFSRHTARHTRCGFRSPWLEPTTRPTRGRRGGQARGDDGAQVPRHVRRGRRRG